MIRFLLASMLAMGLTTSAFAQNQIKSAPQAVDAVASGEMILVDIRSPEEWAETGVARGAIALTMHSPDFPRQISEILNADHGKSVGLICATGGRSGYVVSFLSQNGFANIVDVSEGMIGNARGPGWIARGLPLISSDDAQSDYQVLLDAL